MLGRLIVLIDGIDQLSPNQHPSPRQSRTESHASRTSSCTTINPPTPKGRTAGDLQSLKDCSGEGSEGEEEEGTDEEEEGRLRSVSSVIGGVGAGGKPSPLLEWLPELPDHLQGGVSFQDLLPPLYPHVTPTVTPCYLTPRNPPPFR